MLLKILSNHFKLTFPPLKFMFLIFFAYSLFLFTQKYGFNMLILHQINLTQNITIEFHNFQYSLCPKKLEMKIHCKK
jgi:hypothetical protein